MEGGPSLGGTDADRRWEDVGVWDHMTLGTQRTVGFV
jgi:hypothetical protein